MFFFFSSRRRHTRCALVTGVQTCALPISSFNIAEYGGACPVWNIHTSFRTPGVIVPQFVELPDGERFFTISRTTERPVFSRDPPDRRLAPSLGCELKHSQRLPYAASFNTKDERLFSPIGIH